ncbi:MAG TPA: transglycosylase domain-containing protein [Candidatus Saccharimonadales bacterium]
MPETNKTPGRRRPGKNSFTTKSGNTIKLNRSLGERVRAKREAKARKRAAYLSTLPKNRWKRLLYRLHPKRQFKYWFSREGGIMALKILGIGIVVMFLLMVGVFAYFRKDLPNIKDISGDKLGGSITYYDRTGQTVLWQDYDAVKRVPVTGDKISPYMKKATVAIEDKNFYKHGAFDVQGIIRAGLRDVTSHGGGVQGGSTITQQLVKLNMNWTSDRTIARKFKELILAVELEREYSKDDILNGYLNIAPYGNVEYGVETAARDYFNKSAKDLTLAESAMLAAIPQAPSYYSPYGPVYDSGALIGRQRYILDQMVKQKMITQQEADQAKSVNILAEVHPQMSKYTGITAPFFVLAAKQELNLTYGSETVKRGGWKVTTTLDLNLQQTAEKLVADNISNITRRTGGAADEEALITEDVPTGQIVASVGGTDFNTPSDHNQINYAAGVLIPPGSSFKPYDYAVFIDNNTNVGAGSVLYDTQGALPGYACTNKNRPKNDPTANCLWDYDFLYPGPITLRYALGGSRNIPAVKAMLSAVPNDNSNGKVASINKVIDTASSMMYNKNQARTYNCYDDEALTQTTQCYAAAAIGDGAFLHLDDHVNGLSTMARLGYAIPRTYILKIVDANNKTLFSWTQPKGKQVIKQDSAYIVSDMAADPRASYLPGSCTDTNCTRLSQGGYKFHRFNGWRFAIKTGTTNNGFDGLMTSWSTQYAVVSWVGNHMRNRDLSATGASMEQLTEPLTRGMMEAAHANLKANNWKQPADIKMMPAYVLTKHIHYGDEEPSPSPDLYPAWYQPNTKASANQTIDKVSNKIATSCTPDLAKQVNGGSNDNAFSADIFMGASAAAAATGNDDVHNCSDVKPQVTLTVPDTCNASGCIITAAVTQGTHPISSDQFAGTVDLYISGNKVQSQPVTTSPATVSFTYVPTASGSATVEVRVTDSVLYQGSDSKTITMSTTTGGATTGNTGNETPITNH